MTEFIQQTVNGLAWGSIYALIALGYTMVYGVLRLINFAHGEVYMMGAMIGYYVAKSFAGVQGAFPFVLVLVTAFLFCGLLGVLIERVAYRPLRSQPRITVLITAIGVSLFLQYGGQWLFGADPKFFPALIAEQRLIDWSDLHLNNVQFIIFGVTLLIMAGLWFLVTKTKIGRAMRAVAYSHSASELIGIPLNRVIGFTFFLGSGLAGIGSVLVALSNPKVEPLMGVMPGLKAFVAAVLGGIGSIPGAWIGGLLMGVCETYVVAYGSSTYRDALAFVLLIVILLIRPSGLLGKSSIEKV